MIKEYIMLIDKDFILKPQEYEEGMGIYIPTFLGRQEVTKKAVRYVPDYEKTNKKFAELISKTIFEKAKELGEITKIELVPQPNRKYKLYVKGINIQDEIEKEIEVPEHYGEGE